MENYIIYSDGKVFGKRYNRFLKPYGDGRGYLQVQIAGKNYKIHRLVAEKFIPNPNNLPQVDHIDGDKTNNDVSNLRWVTHMTNGQSINRSGNVGYWQITKSGNFNHRIGINGTRYNKNFQNFAEMKIYDLAIKYALHKKYRV